MRALVVLSSFLVAITFLGAAVYSYLPIRINPWLYAWLWFNVWIAIYEIYIVFHRKELTREKCRPGFWQREAGSYWGFWKDAWNEYTCYADERYLEPDNFVFLIEFINAVLIVCLWVALMAQSSAWVYILLLIQAYHCGIYFISLLHSLQHINTEYPIKTTAYLLISALWLFVPLVLFFSYS